MSSKVPTKNIGARIKAVRLNAGLTQQAFSDSLGVSQGYLSDLEKEIKTPSDTLLIALSNLYEINMDWLLSGKGELSSPSARQSLDLAFMKEVIEAVEVFLVQESKKLSPEKKADLVTLIYETLIKEETGHTGTERETFLREGVSRFIRLAT